MNRALINADFTIGSVINNVDFDKVTKLLTLYKNNEKNCNGCKINKNCCEFWNCGKRRTYLNSLVEIERSFLNNIKSFNSDIYVYLLDKQKSS